MLLVDVNFIFVYLDEINLFLKKDWGGRVRVQQVF